MLGEFSEEYLQEILDPVFRHITLKTEEEMNLLSPDALYAGFLGALFGVGVESVDAAINGLSAESTAMDSSTKDSDYAEFADILNEPEDLENFKYLASLPKDEQEAFIESLTVDALEEGKPTTALEDAEFADILSEPEDLENFKYLASLPKAEQEAFIESLTVEAMEEGKPATALEDSDYAEFAEIFDGLEGTEGWERLKSLPEAEQEAFIETLFEEDSVDALEENNPDGTDEWLFAGTKERDSFSADARDKLTEIVRNGTIKLQRGFMCFPENDPLIANSKNVIPKEGFYDVAIHGSPTAVGFGSKEVNMSPRLLANIIRHSEDYHGENIRLLSCSTGLVEGDNYCFAEELANALGVTVEAPNMKVYTDPKGKIKVGEFGEGQMIPYKPNERGRIK